jgi:hypothetical protein
MFLASCTTYQYSARQTSINPREMDTKVQRAGLKVDYNRKVTATSNYQLTRKDAIAEAEFMCIQDEKIDVVVDPILKIEFNPFKFKKNYRATIIGFAGVYEHAENRLDESKKYSIEDIEKFKLLNDPNFLPYYYQKHLPNGGDVYNYYIKSGAVGAPVPAKSPVVSKTGPSIMLQNQQPIRPFKQFGNNELRKAKQLRDAGISLSVIGAILCLPVGVTMVTCGYETYTSYYGYTSKEPMEEVQIPGFCFIGIGGAMALAGIPMATIGGIRYNKAKNERPLELTLNSSKNGLGLALHF